MSSLEAFKDKFNFKRELAFCIGIEREYFLTDESGAIVPRAKDVLDHLSFMGHCVSGKVNGSSHEPFGYELSACQIETRTAPVELKELSNELKVLDTALEIALSNLGLRKLCVEVAPDDMPLDVFPDPSGRYASISSKMPREVLLAACQVIGTHVHIGMPNHDIALRVYNHVINKCDMLCDIGDNSSGRRLKIYRVVEKNPYPPSYASWDVLYQTALEKGFSDDLRNCWTLIRITAHGTIEFRMFGAVESIDQIVYWASLCRDLCMEVIETRS